MKAQSKHGHLPSVFRALASILLVTISLPLKYLNIDFKIILNVKSSGKKRQIVSFQLD
jgi:hypothetical protein